MKISITMWLNLKSFIFNWRLNFGNAVSLKNKFINFLGKKKIKYIDFGCYTSKPCDYDDYVKIACNGYKEKNIDSVFSFCRSGQGVNISANKNGFTPKLKMGLSQPINVPSHKTPNK